ncbi:MAG TPA: hypothetical protein VHG51_15100 [Longimicrobiaceae bacterium]|nr:hypothetical protein [Longimicrobiaceae bacterium]
MPTRPDARPIACVVAVLLACAAPAAAQDLSALSVGGRVLATHPVGERGAGLDGGTGFGLDVGWELRPGLTLYAGYARTVFPVEGAADAADRVDSGIGLGVLTRRPVAGVPLWFRFGLLLHVAETRLASGGGDGLDDGWTGAGLESGVGVALRVGRRVELLPGVLYAAYPVGGPGGVSHLRGEAGVRFRRRGAEAAVASVCPGCRQWLDLLDLGGAPAMKGVPEVPRKLEVQPELGRGPEQARETECRICRDTALSVHELVDSLKGHPDTPRQLALRDFERAEKFLGEDLAGMRRGTVSRDTYHVTTCHRPASWNCRVQANDSPRSRRPARPRSSNGSRSDTGR